MLNPKPFSQPRSFTRMLQELLNIVNVNNPEKIRNFESETCHYPKGSIITENGAVENYIYLIRKGGVKVSYYNDGKEYILDFWFEGDFFTSYMSFIQQTPSLTQIAAVSETTVERLSHRELELLYESTPKGNEVGRKMAERMYIHKTMKEIALISLTAEQRYLDLLHQSKNLILEAPVKDIASYLGIHPESLSRIRRKIIS